MASSSLNFTSLQISSLIKQSPLNSTRRSFVRPIVSSISEISPATQSSPEKLQVREIPGDYGLPFIGPIKDRLEYFYSDGGREEFFKSRSKQHNSTVFRANMPPGPFIASNPKVIVLLDGKSFPILFDVSKVEKKDLFTGTYMPSVDLTGGYRILSYLDPSEPKHAKLKTLLFFLLKSGRDKILPEFHRTFTELFESLESTLSSKGVASFGDLNDQASFNFLGRALYNKNPAETELKTKGPTLIAIWVLFNLHPILTLGLPSFLEEILIHTFMLPPFLIKSSYNKLYKFFDENSAPIIEEARKLGISKEEACHNLVFATCFNTYGGMKILFPNLMKWVGAAGESVHLKLAEEVRTAVKNCGGTVTMGAIEQMPLLKSVVYETLRIEPPVPLQYAKAKVDLEIESHDAIFKVKKGEMIFGFQPFATKDPNIFNDPEKFVPDRFVGEGENLLKHVLWSNGPETESPTVGNKQCAGKDFVVLVGRLLLVELFLRYDTLTVEVGKSALGSSVNVKSLKKASF